MTSLRSNQRIEAEVLWRPKGRLLVMTRVVRITPRAGREVLALLSSVEMSDFSYESSSGYLAKRIRNMIAGATTDPDL